MSDRQTQINRMQRLLERNKEVTTLHLQMESGSTCVSTRISELRKQLQRKGKTVVQRREWDERLGKHIYFYSMVAA